MCKLSNLCLAATASLILASRAISASPATPDELQLHVPAAGSPEREAISKALRTGKTASVKFDYIKAHNCWAWVDATPLDRKGQPLAEGGTQLLHLENGKWKVIDLSKVPADPADPMDREDVSPGFVKNLLKTYPEVPKDILPKPRH